MEKNRDEIIEELEQFYEAAGFEDVKERELIKMPEEELKDLHKRMVVDVDELF